MSYYYSIEKVLKLKEKVRIAVHNIIAMLEYQSDTYAKHFREIIFSNLLI